jgi:hypothetical protein
MKDMPVDATRDLSKEMNISILSFEPELSQFTAV